MAYSEDVNINMNLMAGAMGGVTAIMGGMSALTSTFSQFGTEAANTFGTLDGLLVGTTALIASFGLKAAEAYGEFEQGMKIVQTVSNQSGAAITELTNKANEMSVAYRTSIGDITDGLQTLGRAGLNSATTQLEVLESGLQTAKLEGRNLNGVLEEIIQNTAMLGGDLKSVDFGKQSEYLNSLMVGTSMTAPIDSHDISQTLQYAGGTAAAAGANLENKDKLEDLMGTVAAFAQKGVKGSMAGTALRAFFTKPASQDNSVTEGLAMIGLSPEALWEDGGKSMKKVSDQIAIIRGQMNALHLSTMDQVEIWGKIVGPKMGQQMMKLQANDIKDLTRDIQSSQSTEALAAQTLQTYNQKVSEMQQQGEVAFRGLGSKAVMFLTPIVDVISKILGLLSNKWVNTTVFAALGSLVSFGIRRIWGMLNTVYRQVKGLLTDVARGEQTINSLAGGSAQGFQNSAEQVDYLNTKLHETDATLQAIQAKSLGLKPGYIVPGGLAGDKIPRDTLRLMEENVVHDVHGILGGEKGEYYSGDHAAEYEEALKPLKEDYLNNKKALDEALEAEEEIGSIRQKINDAQEAADAKHEARVKALNEEYNKRLISERENYSYPDTLVGPEKAAEMEAEWNKKNQAALKEEMRQRLALSTQQRDDEINSIREAGEARIQELTDNVNRAERSYDTSKRKYEEAKNKGFSTLQTRLELNTIEEAERWFADLEAQDKAGTISEADAYSLKRTREVWEDYQNEYALSQMKAAGVKPTYRSRIAEELSPNDTMLAQIFESGDYLEVANAKKAKIDNAIDVLSGNQTLSAKAAKVTENDFNALGKGAKAASDGLSKFRSGIENIAGHISRIAHPDYLQQNATTLQSSALDKLKSKELDLGGKTFSAAMQELSSSVGLSAKEFAVLNQSTEVLRATQLFDEETLKQLGVTAAEIKQQFIEQLASMETEEAERKKLIAALEIEYDKIMGQVGQNGIEAIGGEVGGVKGKLKGVKGKLSSAIGYLGGPVMAAMMGFTFGMQVIQEVQQKWQEKMQEATSQMSEAKDKMGTAEESIRSFYKSQDESLTDADLDKAVDERYAALYDASTENDIDRTKLGHRDFEKNVDMRSIKDEETGEEREMTPEEMIEAGEAAETVSLASDENVRALEENTMALNSATQAYAQGLQKASVAFDDGISGFQGLFTKISDGSAITGFKDADNILLNINQSIESLYAKNAKNSSFFDTDSPVLLDSQSDKSYGGSTDFGAILSADVYKLGTEQGLRQFFGTDYDTIIGLMNSMDSKIGSGINSKEALTGLSSMFTSMPADKFSTAQMYMKDNPETLSRFGKQMFRYEKENPGQSAIMDWRTGKKIQQNNNMIALGSNRMQKKDLQQILNKGKYTVNDKNFERTFKRIMHETGGKLTYANVLAMGSLQQLQDMFKVTNETVAPGVMQTMQGVYQNVSATGMAASNAGDAAGGAGTAGANAAIIASILARKFQIEAEGMVYEGTYLNDPNKPTFSGKPYSKEEFVSKLADMNDHSMDKYRDETLQTIAGTGTSLGHPGASQDYIDNRAYEQSRKLLQENPLTGHLEAAPGVSNNWQHMLNTASQPLRSYFEGASQAAYNSSNVGEYGSGGTGGSGGGGGGGDGGGGSGDSGSNEGTKKSRVDLVLCNKKEIPKLNVNLFKTPPNFTILNKNFKLRDIKINSQDKPKAIMAAVKNGIIETQKRMDPKIIQDESGEYDPLAATEGKATPSGNTPTSSSSSNSN